MPSDPSTYPDIVAHCPVFCFHEQEPYYPCSYDEYLHYSSLVQFYPNGQMKEHLDDEEWDQKKLASYVQAHPSLDWSVIGFSPHIPNPLEHAAFNSKAPIYVRLYETTDAFYVNYILFFYYNYGKGNNQFGWHFSDAEHVTLRFLKADVSLPADVYFGRHGTHEGERKAYTLCTKDHYDGKESKRVRVYVANGSHGCYSEPGQRTTVRFFGIGNDETSDAGLIWRQGQIVVLQEPNDMTIPFAALPVDSKWNSITNGYYWNASGPPSTNPLDPLKGDNRFLLYHGTWGHLSVVSLTDQGWWQDPIAGEASDEFIPSSSTVSWNSWMLVLKIILYVLAFLFLGWFLLQGAATMSHFVTKLIVKSYYDRDGSQPVPSTASLSVV